MKGSLYIIESPFQLLSAMEAAHYFGENNSTLIVKYTPHEKNNQQIDKLLDFYNWQKIVKFRTWTFVGMGDIFLLPYLAFLKLVRKNYNRIFIGEPRSGVMQAFLINVIGQEKYFLDDGNNSFHVQSKILTDQSIESLKIENIGPFGFKIIFYKILGLNRKFNFLPNWFTAFELEQKSDQKVLKHKFQFIKSYLKSIDKQENSCVYFIGAHLSELGIISLETELEFFEFIVQYYKSKKIRDIIYCAHQRESHSKLDLIENISPCIQIRHSDYPLEIDFILKKIRVKNISSYFSTALLTLKNIFDPPEVEMFRIPENRIKEPFKMDVEETYGIYSKYFNVFPLDIGQ